MSFPQSVVGEALAACGRKCCIASLIRIPDSFKKIVVVKDYVKPWRDDNGIQYVGIEDFLLDESLISR